MKFFYLTDSRGNQSATLSFIAATWMAMTSKFLLGGSVLPIFGTIQPISVSEYGVAVAALLGAWWGREYTEKNSAVSPTHAGESVRGKKD